MKRIYQFFMASALFALVINTPAFGQAVTDSVTMGAGYANDIYYSMENGEVAAVDRTNWDIAFYTSVFSAGIIINEGNGVELALYPNADTTGWATLDTTGLSTWPALYNSTEMWEDGAFNRHSLNEFDYGWGVYNPINHNVVGDSLYVVKLADGSAKKIWIVKKMSMQNTYVFRYADLDGSNEVTETITCGDYTQKNFVYYSLQTGELLDREPASDSWDILFTKYIEILMGGTPYPVTGVLNNIDVPAKRYDEVAPDFEDWSSEPMDSTKNPIGYDWKYFDMTVFAYVVEDSIAFFVRNRATDVYKIVFSVFDYTVGKSVFTKTLISPAGFGDYTTSDQFVIYPNPATEFITLETKNGITPEAIRIMDMAGRTVYQVSNASPMTRVNVGDLPGGMYLVTIQAGDENYVQKLLIQNR